MRFLYAVASLALFSATAQAYSTGSPVCKSDADTLSTVAKAGKMGKQADATAFAKTWSFQLWDDNGKMVSGDSLMTNMDYWVTVNGGGYNGVMVYPMFDSQRVPQAKEASVVSLTPGDDTFQSAKCASTVGVTVTHTSGDTKDGQAKVAKLQLKDEKAGKFMLSGIVVTAKSTFGKAVTPMYNLQAGKGGSGGNNTDDTTDSGDDTPTDGGDNGGSTGGNTGGDTGTGNGADNVDPNGASSISFAQSAIALQLIALAAFVLV